MYEKCEYKTFKVNFEEAVISLAKRLEFQAKPLLQNLNEHDGCLVHEPIWIEDLFCTLQAFHWRFLPFHKVVHFELWWQDEDTWLGIRDAWWLLEDNHTDYQRDVSNPEWIPIGLYPLQLFLILFVEEFLQILKCIFC